jgi:hypothetical protein
LIAAATSTLPVASGVSVFQSEISCTAMPWTIWPWPPDETVAKCCASPPNATNVPGTRRSMRAPAGSSFHTRTSRAAFMMRRSPGAKASGVKEVRLITALEPNASPTVKEIFVAPGSASVSLVSPVGSILTSVGVGASRYHRA